jgi:hypothetical protein
MTDRDVVLGPAGESRDVSPNRVVEAKLALVVEDHDRRRGGDDLGERGEVVDRAVGDHRRGIPGPREPADAAFPDREALAADDD